MAAPLLGPDRAVDGRGVPPAAPPAETTPPSVVAAPEAEPVVPGSRVARRSQPSGRRGVVFWLAVGWLLVVLGCAVLANVLPLDNPIRPHVLEKLAMPSWSHPLGTDGLGRDTLSRLVH